MTRSNEKSLFTNEGLSGSIGFLRPLAVLHLFKSSIFQEAPIIRPYARIVGAINTNIPAASQTGVMSPPLRFIP